MIEGTDGERFEQFAIGEERFEGEGDEVFEWFEFECEEMVDRYIELIKRAYELVAGSRQARVQHQR